MATTEEKIIGILKQCKEDDLLYYSWNLGKDKAIFRYGGKYKIDGSGDVLVSRKSILVIEKDGLTIDSETLTRFIPNDKPTPLLLGDSICINKENISECFDFPTDKDVKFYLFFENYGNIEKEEGERLINTLNMSINKLTDNKPDADLLPILQDSKRRIWELIYKFRKL